MTRETSRAGWPVDHDLTARRLRLSHTALGQILDLGAREGLPMHGMHWLVTEWSVVGKCKQSGDQDVTRRAAFEAWSAWLGLDQRAERTGTHDVIELRAAAKDWGGHHLLGVAVWADIYPGPNVTEETP